MKKRRVKITGLGFVTPAGIGKEDFFAGIIEPVSRIKLLKHFPVEAGAFAGGEIEDFKFERYVSGISNKRMARHTQFALVATILALQDANINIYELRGEFPLVMIGASLMDFSSVNKGIDIILKKGPVYGFPSSVFSASVSSISGTIGEVIGGTTRTLAIQSACCAGLDAVGQAAGLIANGEVDLAICGGTEAPLYFHPMLELKMAGLTPGNADRPDRQCRPFDMWRTTGVIGEGACVLILEPEASARPGYAYIDGYAFASDPIDSPCGGLRDTIRLTLANAGLRPSDVESISAWGPGHKIIDAAEVFALREIFGSPLVSIPAVSIKGAIGSPLGAAGAIQAGCAALGLSRGVIPPTVNWQTRDPDCNINLSCTARYMAHRTSLINAHGLSGTNSSIVLTRC